jgi:uncharacterized protein YjbJ (UPF0337 family)
VRPARGRRHVLTSGPAFRLTIVPAVVVGVRIRRQRIARRERILERLVKRTLAVPPFLLTFELAAWWLRHGRFLILVDCMNHSAAPALLVASSGKGDQMNTDQLKGKWHQLKGEAKIRWGKLTDDDLDQASGQTEKLIGLLQERYGYARERAEREVREFEDLNAHVTR